LVAAPAGAASFTNATPITINDAGAGDVPAASTPYPSAIGVSGVVGTVTKVTATLHGFHHGCAHDVDMLLAGPHGQDTLLMSDAGDCLPANGQPAPIELGFDDSGPPVPCLNGGNSPLPAGTYAPTQDPSAPSGNCTRDAAVFAAPAPPGPYPLGLAVFDGLDPNGTWKLYTMDHLSDDNGAIDGGWTLDFTIPAGTLATAPQVKGKPDVGRTLAAVSGTTGGGAAPAYQWNRCSPRGTGCAPIAGAKKFTYKPKRGDQGHRLTVTETAVSSGGNSAPLGSKSTAVVGPALLSMGGTKTAQNLANQHGLIVSLKSNIAGSLVASATAKGARFKRVKRKLEAGKRVRLKLRLVGPPPAGAQLKARLRLVVTDANGVRSTKRLTVRLKR
jgi:hypothetical protein